MFRTPKSLASTIAHSTARMDSVTSVEAATCGVMIFISLLLTWNGEYVALIGAAATIAAYYFLEKTRAHADLLEGFFDSEELHAIKDIRLAQEAHRTTVDEIMSMHHGNTVVRASFLAFGLLLPSLFLMELPGVSIAIACGYAVVTVVNALYAYLALARVRGSRSSELTLGAA